MLRMIYDRIFLWQLMKLSGHKVSTWREKIVVEVIEMHNRVCLLHYVGYHFTTMCNCMKQMTAMHPNNDKTVSVSASRLHCFLPI